MAYVTMMVDRMGRQRREAWQNGKLVFSWTKEEVDAMHAEKGSGVPPWGAYPQMMLARAPEPIKSAAAKAGSPGR